MPFTFRLPDVGEGLHEAEIIRWLVRPGDAVAADQPLVEVQTDKAAVELPSPVAGVVSELHFQDGDVVRVGAAIITIATPGVAAGAPAAAPATAAPAPAGAAPAAVAAPTVASAAGAAPAAVAAPAVAPAAAGASGTAATPPQRAELGPRRDRSRWAPATPSTRRLGRDLRVDVNSLVGTGPAGRVTDADVRLAAAGGLPATETAQIAGAAPGAQPAQAAAPRRPAGAPRPDQRVPLRGVRRVIAQHMVKAAAAIPDAVAIEEADMGALLALRDEVRAAHPDRRLSYLPFIVKAVARALRQHPYLNARLDEEAGEIVLRGEVHMGIATATDEGLMVPVVRDVDAKSALQVAADIADLADRARSRRLKPEELSGSTFTITNIGSVGGILSIPIINHPEVAILGVHRVQERPVGRNGQIVLRPMTYLSLAFDHRVVDGDVAARFLTQVVRYLEHPSLLFVEMI